MTRAKKFVEQTAWYGLFSNSKVVLQVVSSIVLARLLSPADFGLVAMVAVVVAFCELFKDLGMSVAYIQRIEVTKDHANVVFTQSAISGLSMSALMVIFQAQIVGFYGLPELSPIILGMAVSVLLSSIAVTPTAMLRRDSRFKQLGLIGVSGLMASIVVTIVLATLHFGAISIVYGIIVKDLITLTASSVLARWVPSISFRMQTFFEMLKVGGWLSMTRFLGFFSRNLDSMLIGKYFGPVVLGIYNRAYAFMLLPLQKVGNLVAATALPTLKDFQSDDRKLAGAIQKIVITEFALLIPVVMYVWVERVLIIDVLYGPQWTHVAKYLAFLLPVVFFDLGRSALFQVFVIKSETRKQFLLSVIFTFVVITSIVAGVASGEIMTLVMLYSLSKLIIWIPASMYAAAQMNVSVKDVFRMQLECFVPYWPLFILVGLKIGAIQMLGIAPDSTVLFVGFSLVYLVISIVCVNSLSSRKRFTFLFDTFGFLRWMQRRLRTMSLIGARRG